MGTPPRSSINLADVSSSSREGFDASRSENLPLLVPERPGQKHQAKTFLSLRDAHPDSGMIGRRITSVEGPACAMSTTAGNSAPSDRVSPPAVPAHLLRVDSMADLTTGSAVLFHHLLTRDAVAATPTPSAGEARRASASTALSRSVGESASSSTTGLSVTWSSSFVPSSRVRGCSHRESCAIAKGALCRHT
jgi:hypothetical protein